MLREICMAKKGVLDTNALLMVFQFGLHLESELERLLGIFEILIPSSVIAELRSINAPNAKAALALTEKYHVMDVDGRGDEAVLDLAVQENAVLVSNDKELCRQAKEKGLEIVRLRQKKYLIIE